MSKKHVSIECPKCHLYFPRIEVYEHALNCKNGRRFKKFFSYTTRSKTHTFTIHAAKKHNNVCAADNLANETDTNAVSDEDVIILDNDSSDVDEKKPDSKQLHGLDAGRTSMEKIFIKEETNVSSDDFAYLDASHGYESEDQDIQIKIEDVRTLTSSHYDEPSTSYQPNSKVVLPRMSVSSDSSTRILLFCSHCGRKSAHTKSKNRNCGSCKIRLRFMCSLCDKNYSTLTRLRYHIYYGCSGDFRCTYPGCEYMTHDWSELRDHQRLQHNVLPGVPPTPTSPEVNLQCSHCSKWFRQMRSLQKHQLICSGMKCKAKEKSYSCPLCDFSTRKYKDIKRHEEEMHGMVKSRGFYECPYCSKKIVNVKKMRLHVKSCKVKVDIFSCEHCDYKGKSKVAFMQHLKIIHPDL